MVDLKLLWYQALAEPVGLLLAVDDPIQARQALYRARADIGDPELAPIRVGLSRVPGGNLVLVKEPAAQLPSGDSL